MGLLTQAIANVKGHNTDRPPVTLSSGLGLGGFGGMVESTSRTDQLGAMTSSGWLFAVIDRISTAVAGSDWQLYRKQGSEDRTEVESHILLDLWDMPNPFYTQDEFLEVSVNHFSLVGEMWWVVVRNPSFQIPVEIWPVRPDRMRPIPHPTDYISGYIYQIGNEKIFLDIDDVIFIRRPSPLDPYRGIGPIGSIQFDLGSEKAASLWTANFFRNSAIPGGIIETDETMSDPEFETLQTRWRTQHQGVQNAHRVAILEKAHWKERKITQREMQFTDLRRMNRDIIFGAYGVHGAMMGVSENVNRANAEAAEVVFARWTVKPLLGRIRAAINEHLVKVVDPTLMLDFKDPVPANRDQNRMEATEGYRSGVLSLNESRALLNVGAVPDEEDDRQALAFGRSENQRAERSYRAGLITRNEARLEMGEPTITGEDDFFIPSGGQPFQLVADSDGVVRKALSQPVQKDGNPLYPDDVNREESRMERAWTKRLRDEANAIAEFMEQFKTIGKIEPSDLAGYDWDWWTRHSDEVIDELTEVYIEAMVAVGPDIPEVIVQRLASEWATQRGALLLRLDGDINIVAQTRERVNQLVTDSISNGDSLQTLQKSLRDDFQFSKLRAERISRTETATALGQGQKGAAISQGRDEKRCTTQGSGDPRVDQLCLTNEAQGWISIGQVFLSGHDTIPFHIQCQCNVRYRTARDEEDGIVTERVDCPKCLRRLPINNLKGSAEVYCKRCDERFTVE